MFTSLLPSCAPFLQLGGFEDAKRGVAEGRFEPEQFKILTRYAGVCIECMCGCCCVHGWMGGTVC